MSSLEPALALISFESALRELMAYAYGRDFGVDWLEKVSTADQRARWRQRRAESLGRTKRGVAEIEPIGLAWSECYELLGILDAFWEPVAEALGEKAKVMPLLRRFNALRNDVAHSRPLLPFESDLLSGIAGQIRNMVTIYMSREAPGGELYPRIESISDNYGNRITPGLDQVQGQPVLETDTTLHPGDVVILDCIGWDPEGRALIWTVTGRSETRGNIVVEGPSGEVARLTWTVSDSDVAEYAATSVMLSADAPYHRNGYFDQVVNIVHRIRPPRP